MVRACGSYPQRRGFKSLRRHFRLILRLSMPKKPAGRKTFESFKSTCLNYGMIVPGDTVLAACSGGPDSMALVALLLELRGEMPFDIHIAHFNHKLRGEARADEEFVREMTSEWVLPLTVGSKNVRLFAARQKLNLEEAGRKLRYDFLKDAARKTGAGKIATGHNQNDQAETVLMRIMRGTGATGLAGIAPVTGPDSCPLVRPLIEIERRDIVAYLMDNEIPFRSDETNLDRRFLRNRIRLELVPELEKNYEPRIVEHLARLARIIREEEELLDSFIRGLSRQFIIFQDKRISLDVKTLAAAGPGLARRVVREFVRELKGDLRAVSFDDVDSILSLGEGKEKPLGKNWILRRERGLVGIKKKTISPNPFLIHWDGEEVIPIGETGEMYRGTIIRRSDEARWKKLEDGLRGDDHIRAVLDLDKLVFPLLVRSRRPGDRYRPLGAPGRAKLKKIQRAKGIGEDKRARLPVFLSGKEIIWLPGLPVAESFKVSRTTKAAFVIERIPSGAPPPASSRRSRKKL